MDGLLAVIRVCKQPATSQGIFLGLIFHLFFLFKQRHGHAAKCVASQVDANPGGKPQKEKAPPTSLPVASSRELRKQKFSCHGSPLCHAGADVAQLTPAPRAVPRLGVLRGHGDPQSQWGFSYRRPQGLWVWGAPLSGKKKPGARGGLHAPAGAARGAGACPNQRENLIKISDGAR